MTTNLLLDSIEVQGFRAFRDLKIEHLGRVNLIVGKNNMGKSALLEALRLYAERGSPMLIWELLEARDESRRRRFRASSRTDSEEQGLAAIKYLFYGRSDIRATPKPIPKPIQIGSIRSKGKTIFLEVGWFEDDVRGERERQLELLELEDYGTVDSLTPVLSIRIGRSPSAPSAMFTLDPDRSSRLWRLRADRREFKEIPNIFISASGLDDERIGGLWDAIALTDLESEVLKSLSIIAPNVQGISLMVEEPIPIVRIAGLDSPIPLRNMGEGMSRIFGIALALVNAKDGMLLVDEIESGLHYSVQPDMWRLVFELAHRLNIQVFATSHSWDCIEAFQKAAVEDTQEQGMLIRLAEKGGDIAATLFNEEELTIATRNEIEVR